MNFEKNTGSRSLYQKVRHIFNIFMSLFYLCFGLYLVIYGWYSLTKTQSMGIGVLLTLYSVFRFYRIWKATKMNPDENQLNED